MRKYWCKWILKFFTIWFNMLVTHATFPCEIPRQNIILLINYYLILITFQDIYQSKALIFSWKITWSAVCFLNLICTRWRAKVLGTWDWDKNSDFRNNILSASIKKLQQIRIFALILCLGNGLQRQIHKFLTNPSICPDFATSLPEPISNNPSKFE